MGEREKSKSQNFEKNGMIFESDEMNECLSAVFVSRSL